MAPIILLRLPAAARLIRARDGRQAIGARLVQPAGVSGIRSEGVFGTRTTEATFQLLCLPSMTKEELNEFEKFVEQQMKPRYINYVR
jgi:hypothetical protein